MEKTFKWGIIGLGRIANTFAQAAEAVDGTEVWAVASRSDKKAEIFADKYNIPLTYGSYSDIVQNKELDAIYIATPHPYHLDSTIMCLENKIPVLCEKPLGMNIRENQKMMEAAKENNTFLMEALWTRFLPTTLKLKKLIDKGKLGDIKLLDISFCFKADQDPTKRNFNKQLGGGTILDIGIYPLFLSLFLLGMPETIHALGTLHDTDVDESCSVCMKYADGTLVNMHFSFMVDIPMEARILGTKAAVKLHHFWFGTDTLDIIKKNEIHKTIKYNYRSNGFEYEIEEVMKCVREGKKQSDIWSFEKSNQLMELMDEVRRQVGVSYDVDK